MIPVKTERFEESIDDIKILRFKNSNFLNNIAKSGFGISFSWLIWFFNNVQKYDIVYFRSIWNFTSLIGPVYCVLINKKFGFCASGKLSKYAIEIFKNKRKAVLLFLNISLIKPTLSISPPIKKKKNKL